MIPTNLLSLLHVNICNLYKNIDLLEELISKLPQTPDRIALTETKINKKKKSLKSILQDTTLFIVILIPKQEE